MNDLTAPLRLCLDRQALVSNWRVLTKASGTAATGAAVKANGYGLGARAVVRALADAGCRDFFVASWAEAAEIADLVPAGQIAVLSGVQDADLAYARQSGIVPVLNTPQQIARWKGAGGGPCHIMLDSGINRLGIGCDQLENGLLDGLAIDILMSHLASADEDVLQNAAQLERFTASSSTIPCARRSLANSAGIQLGRAYHFDLTRPGLSLYGGIARPELAGELRQVAHIEAQVLQVRRLRRGDAVGYNATHICATDMRVATISLGYADGYLRGFSGVGLCRFDGVQLPVVGRVSMDLVTLDADLAPDIAEGDWVEVDYHLPVAARISGLSQYELLTGLGKRFDRVWRG